VRIPTCRKRGAVKLAAAAMAVTLVGTTAAAKTPEWLEQAASSSIPSEFAKADAVVLLDEQLVAFEGAGASRVTRHRAVRILTPEGRDAAIALIHYDAGSAKVNELRAWIVRPGSVTELGADRTLDLALVNGDVFNEARARTIAAGSDIEVGHTFGWECRIEEGSVLREFEWTFQDEVPTLCSRFAVDVPRGWTLKTSLFNHAAVDPVMRGAARTWELRNLPALPEEAFRPPLSSLVPRLAVSMLPPSPRPDAVAFETWDSLAAWLSDLSQAPSRPNEAVAAKAREITRQAGTPWARVRAIASYVQSVPYASIQMGTGRGGGYRPRPAADVMSRHYGDCKDKSNLMCCMLRSLGFDAYLVAVYSSDRTYVREEWPAAQQFNHCIVALAAPPDTGPAPVIEHPKLGRLLLFDPTDASTPIGDLPIEEQGSLAILMVREPGALVRLPILPAERNRMDRRNDVTLAADGSIRGTMQERSWGSVGATERRLFQSLATTPYRERVQAWLTSTAPRAVLTGLRAETQDSTQAFELNLDYSAERYAQITGSLLFFRPTFVERWDVAPSSDGARTSPIEIQERACTEVTKVRLPSGVVIDEFPDPVRLETPFGTYRWEIERGSQMGEILVHREIAMHRVTLPPDQYPALRSFYERVRAAEQAPIVLARKGE